MHILDLNVLKLLSHSLLLDLNVHIWWSHRILWTLRSIPNSRNSLQGEAAQRRWRGAGGGTAAAHFAPFVEVRDFPHRIFASWAPWTRDPARWPEFSANRRRRRHRRRRPPAGAAPPPPSSRRPPILRHARNFYSSIWTLRSNNMRWNRQIWTLRSNNKL